MRVAAQIFALLLLLLAPLLLAYKINPALYYGVAAYADLHADKVVLAIFTVFFIMGTVYILGFKLQSSFLRQKQNIVLDADIPRLIDALEKANKNTHLLAISDADRQKILASFSHALSRDFVRDVVSGITRVRDQPKSKSFLDRQAVFAALGYRGRLVELAENLGERSNLAIKAGVISAAVGIILIFWKIDLERAPSMNDVIEMLAYYGPKASMIFLIEALAFFFLRLYRKTLDEIKYVHNELTNVEARIVALMHASQSKDPSLSAACITSLLATERNFVLKKGETTVSLEMSREESSLARQLIKEGGGIFQRVRTVKPQ